jgi:polyphosphate kinase 2
MADKAQKVKSKSKPTKRAKLDTAVYERELARLQLELVHLQEWVVATGARVVVIFEGRDAAGKGGAIKRIAEPLNPRVCRIAALPAPSDRERGEWYFQRYIAHLPAAGQITLFDRSWYNRAGVETVLGFCTAAERGRFLRQCPDFEQMLVEDGIIVLKYWFSVSDQEQQQRFQERLDDPSKRWKISAMDLESRRHYIDYSRAKDEMFAATDTKFSPWHVVEADDKKAARLNCIAHLLSSIPYERIAQPELELPKRQRDSGYRRPARDSQSYVPDYAATLAAHPSDG